MQVQTLGEKSGQKQGLVKGSVRGGEQGGSREEEGVEVAAREHCHLRSKERSPGGSPVPAAGRGEVREEERQPVERRSCGQERVLEGTTGAKHYGRTK